jgi:16S rRNA (guanine966-N2)-methyltransferase
MRIIAGELKNQVIQCRGKNQETASEMVREALFNILGGAVIDSRFADLFAGSGSVGLEALSRGASRVTFVEKRKPAAGDIKRTLTQLSIGPDRARVWDGDVFHLGQNPSDWAEWDIAFLDPPRKVGDNFLNMLVSRGVLVPGTLVVVLRPVDYPPSLHSGAFRLLEERRYGRSALFFYS